MKKVAIIGAGNIGMAIAEGIVKFNFYKEGNLILTKRRISNVKKIDGVMYLTDNCLAVSKSEIIIIAVQPVQLFDILDEIKAELSAKKHTVISVVTGVTLANIEQRLNINLPIFRAMPNTAAAVQQSMTLISRNEKAQEKLQIVEDIFAQLGEVLFINDKKMGAATVLAACGTAFVMRYIRAAMQGGIEIGFDAEVSKKIVQQTVMGAASLLAKNNLHPEAGIDRVTTPLGITIAGLNEMEHQGFSSALIKGISVSFNKISDI